MLSASAVRTCAYTAWKARAATNSSDGRFRCGTGIAPPPIFATDLRKNCVLRFFDQIRFYPVSEETLLDMRQDFLHGKFNIKIEEQTFSLRHYNAFLAANDSAIARFKTQQQTAFEAERERWKATGQADFSGDSATEAAPANELELAPGARAMASPVAGSLWKVLVKPGERVSAGAPLMIIESMKMEINVNASEDGVVQQILCNEGAPVAAGQNLIVIGQSV